MRKETEKVVGIIQEAGKIAMSYFEQLKDHHISTKDDGSLLTIADLEVDKFLRESLESAFPEYSVLSEESENIKNTEKVWVVDPIDATRNFASGNPYFAISIGLIVNNIAEIGIIYAPAKNELYVGELGGEAFLNNEKINVSNKSELNGAKILLDKGLNPKTIDAHKILHPLFKQSNILLNQQINCAALDLCAVARGKEDAFVHYRARGWDIAAGVVILQAAGGTVSQLDGSPKNLFQPGIVATNSLLHDKIVAITKNCI